MTRRALLPGLVLLLGLEGAPAVAKATATLPYVVSDVWPSAIRFLRIERGYTIREKDVDAGYVLFELVEGQRKYRGSLELVRATESGREATKAIFSLPDLPRHFEILLSDKLAEKVREDLGAPAAPTARRPPVDEARSPAADAGAPR
jgi:hypothetical protein